MNRVSKGLLSLAILGLGATPVVSYATNGYFLIGFGAKSRAMGGAGVAYGQDGLASAINPATMADVGDRFDIGGEFFNPPRAIKHDSSQLPSDVQSNHDIFLIPNMGGVWKYNDKINYGFAFIGAGSQTEYAQDGTSSNVLYDFNSLGGTEAGVELVQMQLTPSISYKVDSTHTVGVTAVVGIQVFRAEGLGAFGDLGFTASNENFTDEGHDYSYGGGIRLGWLGKFADDKLNVGFNYSSKVYMSRFRDYSNLFAEQGDFDIPENYTLGIAYAVNDDINVLFDVQRINYSGVASINNPGPLPEDPDAFFPAGIGVTGLDNGMGFGWSDMTVYKLGVDYQHSEKWTFRAGLNYGETPIQNDQLLFNQLAPAVVEMHVTLGLTYVIDEDFEVSANFMHAFENELTGKTPFYPDGVTNYEDLTEDNIAINMEQTSLGVSLGIKF
ncbi:MAG: outer membrane protein transport protein [Gammaproteobacteria bacterium]|nr:outer membrane protein transport protein [Gammaproteobacteria bacterium]